MQMQTDVIKNSWFALKNVVYTRHICLLRFYCEGFTGSVCFY